MATAVEGAKLQGSLQSVHWSLCHETLGFSHPDQKLFLVPEIRSSCSGRARDRLDQIYPQNLDQIQ